MKVEDFVANLRSLHFENAFNPYDESCPRFDEYDAPARRREILTDLLNAGQSVELDSIWIGRDLGYRGGRRTGLALTDDVHFHDHLARWGLQHRRPTVGRAVPERTASAIWQMLNCIEVPIFLWNVFPLHPFCSGDPFSNRAHNAKERLAGISVLRDLVSLLKPKRLVAIGNDAAQAITTFGDDIARIKVRHPSYGGHADFSDGIRANYNLASRTLL